MSIDLFSPISLGPTKLSNRTVMAPMTRTRATEDHIPTDLMAEYYAQRASAGLIITEATHVSEQGTGGHCTPGIHTPEQTDAWQKVTEAVHDKGGKIFVQLWHTGRTSHSYYQKNGKRPVSSSAIAKTRPVWTPEGRKEPEIPTALTIDGIAQVVDDFARSAENAMMAGFDGIELHAANGYLIDQFLRDGVNQRTDQYGGSIENRSRFLLELIEAVTLSWNSEKVGVRLSPTNPVQNMSDSDPVALFTSLADQLDDYNLAYLHLAEARPEIEHSMKLKGAPYIAPMIRDIYSGHLILNAGYTSETGSETIKASKADLIAYGVPYIANPDLMERFKTHHPLNEPNRKLFYGKGAEGYTDYSVI